MTGVVTGSERVVMGRKKLAQWSSSIRKLAKIFLAPSPKLRYNFFFLGQRCCIQSSGKETPFVPFNKSWTRLLSAWNFGCGEFYSRTSIRVFCTRSFSRYLKRFFSHALSKSNADQNLPRNFAPSGQRHCNLIASASGPTNGKETPSKTFSVCGTQSPLRLDDWNAAFFAEKKCCLIDIDFK